MQKFSYIPEISEPQPGFELVVDRLKNKKKLAYVKLNHGIWEMLARLEKAGVHRSEVLNTDAEELDKLIGISGIHENYKPKHGHASKIKKVKLSALLGNKTVPFWASGLMGDVLEQIKSLPSYDTGMIFTPSLTPWPYSQIMSGMPVQNYSQCQDLIEFFTDSEYLLETKGKGLTGHEFKSSVISGHFWDFVSLLHDRPLMLIMHEDAYAVFRSLGIEHAKVFTVPLSGARLHRFRIKAELFEWLTVHQGEAPIVITSAGEATCSWLGIEAFQAFKDVQFIDLGGAMAAFSPLLSVKTPWVKIFSQSLIKQLDSWPPSISKNIRPIYSDNFSKRHPGLIRFSASFGVNKPLADDGNYLRNNGRVSFIENKPPSFSRIADFMRLSQAKNQYTGRGPVVGLLEAAIAMRLNLPEHRKVVIVSSDKKALQLACRVAEIEVNEMKDSRWVSSAYTLLSSAINPIKNIQVIDCSLDGKFSIENLGKLETLSYDGVIYSNFLDGRESWQDAYNKCKELGKAFVVDNTVFLLDRPPIASSSNAPIEVLSAGHEKPWGHGECGVIICNAKQEMQARKLMEFGEELSKEEYFLSVSAQLSDLSAAAILDRLERMHEWGPLYRMQQSRHWSWLASERLGVKQLLNTNNCKTPPYLTPYLSKHPLDWSKAPSSFEVRCCSGAVIAWNNMKFPNADFLLSRVFFISNSPEMRLISRSVFTAEIRNFLQL